MKQGRSLTELVAEVERQANAKRDYLVRSPAVLMTDEARLAVPVRVRRSSRRAVAAVN